ncbi:hypothetical protein PoB_000170200 [Plakobranchus ocellatus]|uniref:Uncharacterized protein n=1 Tax=Plakobranchus ocellatus TaxID=259542 RepID=A0AAV3XXK4_9GAST|nr:hypothetical protein PoB_000170200 [Plakobranchus ocellatus]
MKKKKKKKKKSFSFSVSPVHIMGSQLFRPSCSRPGPQWQDLNSRQKSPCKSQGATATPSATRKSTHFPYLDLFLVWDGHVKDPRLLQGTVQEKGDWTDTRRYGKTISKQTGLELRDIILEKGRKPGKMGKLVSDLQSNAKGQG